MIALLPKWNLRDSKSSFYDAESVTLIELAGSLNGKMNELINDYNSFVDGFNKKVSDFEFSTLEERRTFETAMRQEFQDFIDVINIKYLSQEQKIETAIEEAVVRINTIISDLLDTAY